VLERAYGYGRADIAAALDGLLSATELVIEAADEVGVAVDRYRNDGFGFADLMIAAAARRAEATELVTFDRKAARLPGVRLLVA
jgi:predicted nucleic-acid-binding protein